VQKQKENLESLKKWKKPSSLSNEEEVMLMNIDYFEVWDRIHFEFEVTESQVINSFSHHRIKMI
jgi:hypothetical protein